MSGFNYNGENLPKGGIPGELLVKVSNADYYCLLYTSDAADE